jgi:hypothetical protein
MSAFTQDLEIDVHTVDITVKTWYTPSHASVVTKYGVAVPISHWFRFIAAARKVMNEGAKEQANDGAEFYRQEVEIYDEGTEDLQFRMSVDIANL